ncbi:hypothetical protein D3C80_2000050 [compost metagenome]
MVGGVHHDHEEVAEVDPDRVGGAELARERAQAPALGGAGREVVAQDRDRQVRILRPDPPAMGLEARLEVVEGRH